MRVHIIGTRGYPSYYGGFETLIRHLAPSLVRSGWDVTVFERPGATVKDDPDVDERVERRRSRGIESKSLSTLSYGLTSSLRSSRERPEAALVMNVANGYWLPLLRKRGIRTLVNVDGMEWEREKWGTGARRVFRTGAGLTARFADEIVCDSVEISRRWQRDFGRAGLFIPYGADLVPVLDPPLEFARAEYVLLVARFVPENSVPAFFQAVERLATRWKVVLVGSTGYGGELDEEARRLAAHRNVTWLGHVANDRLLYSLWNNAAAYFHGHTVGGTNPALVQAMGCGAPVVAVDTPYNREVLGDGAAFSSGDPDDIYRQISAVASSPERQRALAENAVERARTKYTWEGVCASYEQALSTLAERSLQ